MNDTYSKIMLTIIAVALSINTFQSLNVVNPAHAEEEFMQKIRICDFVDEMRCARVDNGHLLVKTDPKWK